MADVEALIVAKEAMSDAVLDIQGVVGIGVGVRDDESPDFTDPAIRIFVEDVNDIPPGLPAATPDVPVVILARKYVNLQLPDTYLHRPVCGGSSVGPERSFPNPAAPYVSGTLGAIVRGSQADVLFGLSNFHVLGVDSQRSTNDQVIQPEATTIGPIPGTRIGQLAQWDFPESATEAEVDAAICSVPPGSSGSIIDVGVVRGINTQLSLGMSVRKRGKTTGLTYGLVLGVSEDHNVDQLGYGSKRFKHQIEIKPDFPQSLYFSQEGDSGSLVVDDHNAAVGLLFAGFPYKGDYLNMWGLANPIASVVAKLPITFDWPLPAITSVAPQAGSVGQSLTLGGVGFLAASSVDFGTTSARQFDVVSDGQITVEIPNNVGLQLISVTGPGGTGGGWPFVVAP